MELDQEPMTAVTRNCPEALTESKGWLSLRVRNVSRCEGHVAQLRDQCVCAALIDGVVFHRASMQRRR